jgi:hypothetical protein
MSIGLCSAGRRRYFGLPGRSSSLAGRSSSLTACGVIAALCSLIGCHVEKPTETPSRVSAGKKLTHEETLAWIREHKAWRHARKTKPIWARELEPAEIGKAFATADHADEVAREGYWLCVGVAGEPWFQKPAKVEDKYDEAGTEGKQFSFDSGPRAYRIFKPKEGVRNWVARVEQPGIEGFYIRPGYDMSHPLYSPGGGYVVTGDVEDPYAAELDDVWLVQQALFESTYETEE